MKVAELAELINGNSEVRIIDAEDYVISDVKDGIPARIINSEVADVRIKDNVLEITINEVDNTAALENIEEALKDIKMKLIDIGDVTPKVYNEELVNYLGCLGEIVDNTRAAIEEGKDWDVYLD